VVGLSMGGAQALQIGLHHRDRFATIGVFGSGMNKTAFAEKFPKLEGEALDLVYIGVGKEDGARTRAKELSEALGERGIANTFQEVEGGHTYPTWRTLLVETAPLLFRKRAH